jgi:hypothetical protein
MPIHETLRTTPPITARPRMSRLTVTRWRLSLDRKQQSMAASLIIAVLLLLLRAALLCLGWVKAMQQMQFYQAIKTENYPKKKSEIANLRMK